MVLPLRSVTVRRQAAAAAESLPDLARRAIGDLLEQLRVLDEHIGGYDREIETQARLSEPAQRLMKIRGIGPTTALPSSPPWATPGIQERPAVRRLDRSCAGQYSTGGKTRLEHIN